MAPADKSSFHPRRGLGGELAPGRIENAVARETYRASPMGEIDFIAKDIAWSPGVEGHSIGLVEALAGGSRNAFAQRGDLQTHPVRDEIGHRLGKQHAALTHGMKDRFVLVDDGAEVLQAKKLFRGDEEPVVEERHAA